MLARVTADLIGTIYEAGAVPELWPEALQKVASAVGARGGNLIRSTTTHLEMHSSPEVAEITREFDRQGWNSQNSRVSRLLDRAGYPGFVTDSDLHSAEEIASLPIYTQFLTPRGAAAGAATVIQGSRDDGLIFAMEAFVDHAASRSAVPMLNELRPHIARAASLTGEIQSARVKTLVDAFDAVGSAIGLLDRSGKLLAASGRFDSDIEELATGGSGRLRLLDEESDRRFSAALADFDQHWTGASVAVRNRDKIGAGVLHLLPARRDARELFSNVSIFAILARPNNEMLPDADVIGALFDLTPAEARIARGIAQGLSPADLAKRLNVSGETIRAQLKRVFSKTSTRKQNELSLLIAKLR